MADDDIGMDKGEIETRIGTSNGRVVIIWPKAIAWVTFDPDSADNFANMLKIRAAECRVELAKAAHSAITKH
jgi:hypothetical protein